MAPDPSAHGLFQFMPPKKDADVTPKPPVPAHVVMFVRHPDGHSHPVKIETSRPVELIAKIGKKTVVRVDDPKLNDYNLWNVKKVVVYPENGPVKSVKCSQGAYLEVMVSFNAANIGTKMHEMMEAAQIDKTQDLPGPLATYTVENGKVVPIQHHSAPPWDYVPSSKGKAQSMFEMVQEYKEKYLDLPKGYTTKAEVTISSIGKPEEVLSPFEWEAVGSLDNGVTLTEWVSSKDQTVKINPEGLDPDVTFDGMHSYTVGAKTYEFKYVATEMMYYVKKGPSEPWLSISPEQPHVYLNRVAKAVRERLAKERGLADYTTKPVITRVNAINGYVITMYENNKYYEATIVDSGDVEGLTAEFPIIFRKRVNSVIRSEFVTFDDPERFWYNPNADHVKAIQKEYKYPAADSPYSGKMMELKQIIINLNDCEMWSREAIADWLDTLDEQPVFYPKAQEPTPRVVNTARVVTLEPHLQKKDPKSGQ